MIVIFYGLSTWYMPHHDPDLGWHLLGGSLTITEGRAPTTDIINWRGAAWIDYHWLAQVILFAVYTIAGFTGLKILLGVTVALTGVLITSTVRALRREISPLLLTVISVVSTLSVAYVSSIRPQMFSLLATALAVRLLIEKPKRYELTALTIITALITNMHVYWILIPAVWFMLRCLPRIADRPEISARYAWGGLVLLIVAGGCSPYGFFSFSRELPFGIFTNYALIPEYFLQTHLLRRYIIEFTTGLGSPFPAPLLILVPLCIIIRFSVGTDLPRKIGFYALACSGLALGISTVKFLGVCGIFTAPLLALFAPRILSSMQRLERHTRVILYVLLALATAQLIHYSPWYHDIETFSQQTAQDACAAIAKLPVEDFNKPFVIMTSFDDGGWCRWGAFEAAPKRNIRVTTDGRTQFVPIEEYALAFDAYALKNGWSSTISKWNPDAILVKKNTALAELLINTQRSWTLGYQNELFAVFYPSRSSLTASIK